MAKIGIICNNYKVNTYKKRLKEKRYIFSTEPQPGNSNLTLIKIKGDLEKDQPLIHQLCKEIEAYFLAKRN